MKNYNKTMRTLLIGLTMVLAIGCENYEDELLATQAELVIAQASLEAANGSIQQLTNQAATAANTIAGLETSIVDANAILTLNADTIQELMVAGTQTDAEIAELIQSNDDLANIISNLTEDLIDENIIVVDLTAEITALNAANADVNNANANQADQIASLTTDLTAAQADVAATNASINRTAAIIAELQRTIDELQARLLQLELDAMNDGAGTATDTMDYEDTDTGTDTIDLGAGVPDDTVIFASAEHIELRNTLFDALAGVDANNGGTTSWEIIGNYVMEDLRMAGIDVSGLTAPTFDAQPFSTIYGNPNWGIASSARGSNDGVVQINTDETDTHGIWRKIGMVYHELAHNWYGLQHFGSGNYLELMHTSSTDQNENRDYFVNVSGKFLAYALTGNTFGSAYPNR